MSALKDHLTALDGSVELREDGAVRILDETTVRERIDHLARASAFGEGAEQATARWLIWEIGQALGVRPASINALYLARGRGETPVDFTVPAINVRAMAFDCARAIFRAATARDVGALILEIARSEIGYTGQRPGEYVASVTAAAIREGFRGPLFIQGDHFQVSASRYFASAEAELETVRELTREAIGAGFYNIDVDTSTLVDLDLPTLEAQQALNAGLCAELTQLVREIEPDGVTISVGGEIGEVGGKNSTPEELHAFMAEYAKALGDGLVGLSKISIQTGTAHGGTVLSDGTLAQVKVDFDTLRRLSKIAREEYGLAGAVQHGASTLPENAFGKFAEAGACEVHLATNFQNMLFDRLPADLRDEIYAWLRETMGDQRKAEQSEEQFIYANRKHALGPFKAKLWGMDDAVRAEVREAWEAQFGFLFEQLNVTGTRALVDSIVSAVEIHKSPADFGVVEREQEDTSDLAD